jgi:hypothetical protein
MSQFATDKLLSAHLKVERAKKHIADLEDAIRAFLGSHPYEVATRRDRQTRRLSYDLARIEDVPTNISAIAGDAIHNLRSSLDHLAYRLFLAGTEATSGLEHKVFFPIAEDATRYQVAISRKKTGNQAGCDRCSRRSSSIQEW